MKTLYGIQYLRAAAALAVVLFHAAEKSGYHFAIGAAGVDIFFVISGFIMWVICDRRPVTPIQFLTERARRIVPVYWLATAAMVAGAMVGLFPNLKLTVVHVMGSLFFLPVRSPSNGEIWPVLVQGWTLNYEMFFYLAFASGLLLPKALRLSAIAVLFVGLAVFGMATSPDNAFIFTYTRPIILEFVAGMILGQAWLSGRVPGALGGAALLGLGLAGFAMIQIGGFDFDAWTCGPLAVAMVLGILALEAKGLIAKWLVPAFLGNASYSIYLWHTFAISVVAKLGLALGLPGPLILVSSVLAGIAIGSLAYLMIERPLVQWFQVPREHPVSEKIA